MFYQLGMLLSDLSTLDGTKLSKDRILYKELRCSRPIEKMMLASEGKQKAKVKSLVEWGQR